MEDTRKQSQEVVPTKSEKIALRADFGEIYVRVRGGQIMAPVKAQITLFGRLKHFYSIKKGEYAISASGYVHLNKVASINLVTPQYVVVDGEKKPNPHVERNMKTKAIETVNIRKVGIGYSPIGNITVIDKTLFYNIYTYFIQSVQAKMKKVVWKNGNPTKEPFYPDCAFTGTLSDKPKEGKWVFFETIEPLGIWVNYEHPAILDCLDENTQRQRFGDRMAQKIVERNILKDHPAIGVTQVELQKADGKDVVYVTVYGYRHDLEPSNLAEIMKQIEAGSEEIDVKAEVIEEVPHEEEKQAVREVVEEEPGEKEKSPATMKEPSDEHFLNQEEMEKDVDKKEEK